MSGPPCSFLRMGMPTELIDRFRSATEELEVRYANERMDDKDAEAALHTWIDGSDQPLEWTHPDHVTSDE